MLIKHRIIKLNTMLIPWRSPTLRCRVKQSYNRYKIAPLTCSVGQLQRGSQFHLGVLESVFTIHQFLILKTGVMLPKALLGSTRGIGGMWMLSRETVCLTHLLTRGFLGRNQSMTPWLKILEREACFVESLRSALLAFWSQFPSPHLALEEHHKCLLLRGFDFSLCPHHSWRQ